MINRLNIHSLIVKVLFIIVVIAIFCIQDGVAEIKDAKPESEALKLLKESSKAYKSGDEDKALALAEKSVKLSGPADSATYVKASNMVAYMWSAKGEEVKALKVAFNILREAEKKGWKKLNISSRACIADLYRAVGNPKAALPYAIQASADAVELKDTAQYIFGISTLSNLYSDRKLSSPGNLKIATKYMLTILAPPFISHLSKFDKARYLNNLGRLYVNQDELSKAEQTLKQSIELSSAEKFAPLEKTALNELMSLYILRKDYPAAITYGERALLAQPEKQTNQVLQRNVFDKLSQAYQGNGNYELALTYYQKATDLNDQISAKDKAKDAAELDKKYANDTRLLKADNQTKLIKQQRNYITIIAIIIGIALIAIYSWINLRRKRKSDLILQEHHLLQRLDVLKTRFFANISHELRTPLTLIIGPADQLINEQVEDDKQRKDYLQSILNNGKRLLNLVNELLDMGKLEAGKLLTQLKRVELAYLIEGLQESFAGAVNQKAIIYKLTSSIPAQLFVELDTDKFEKIANNLLSNALKFTPANGTISISAKLKDSIFEFSVSNTGTGIHPDDLSRIFDRYYQGENSAQPMEGGTGIGLAIAKEFAELMGGQLTVVNDWGRGVTFKVALPITGEEMAQNELPGFENEDETAEVVILGKEKLVLVVEDNPLMTTYISSLLTPIYTVITAANGLEALQILKSAQTMPNIIISDVMMPKMDGFTLLETIKQDPTICGVPVILLTALTDSRHRIKALNIGVDDYITKPFLSAELLARTANLITNAALRSTAPSEEKEPLVASPSDLKWLSELEILVRQYTGKADLNLAEFSYAMAISERQLFRRIKALTGLTPNKYIRVIRLQIAREAIESGKYRTISEISYAAGFETPAYFSKLFKEHYGVEVLELL